MNRVLLLCALVPMLSAEPAAVEAAAEDSFVAVRLDKGGLFAFAGHQHGILATEWKAEVCFDPERLEQTSVRFSIATPGLRIDTAEARRRAELEPDSGPGEDDVVEIQRTMLAPENLAAEEHPAVTFQSSSARSTGQGRIELRGDLTIRDRVRPIVLPVEIRLQPDGRVEFIGEGKLKQSDYGIKPVSIGGVVKVKDQVTTLFQVAGRLTDRPCP